jgi:hypothetical protein
VRGHVSNRHHKGVRAIVLAPDEEPRHRHLHKYAPTLSLTGLHAQIALHCTASMRDKPPNAVAALPAGHPHHAEACTGLLASARAIEEYFKVLPLACSAWPAPETTVSLECNTNWG